MFGLELNEGNTYIFKAIPFMIAVNESFSSFPSIEMYAAMRGVEIDKDVEMDYEVARSNAEWKSRAQDRENAFQNSESGE